MELMEAGVMEDVQPGYKRTEVGVIPEDWDIIPLSELMEFQNGVNAEKEAYGKGIPFINVLEVITRPHLDISYVPGRVELPRSQAEAYSVRKGDVLFNRTSETLEEIGLASVFMGTGPVVFGGFVIRGRPTTQRLDPLYSGYGLRLPAIRSQLIARGQGAIRANIGQADMRKVLVPLPPLTEQRLIASALSDADGLVAGLEAVLAKKRAIKQGALQALLTPPGQPGHRRLPGFSGGWGVKSFGELFSFGGGYSASRAQLSHKGHSYLHYGDIHMATSTVMDVQAEYHRIPKLEVPLSEVPPVSLLNEGDIVFVDASEDSDGVSKHVVVSNPDGVPFISGLHTIVAKPKPGLLVKSYSAYCFQTEDLKRQFRFYAVGTKVSGISKSNIPKLTIPLPSLNEQAAIGEILSDLDAELRALEGQLAKLLGVKQGLMQELLTGRKRLV